jgi:hypothetical protein
LAATRPRKLIMTTNNQGIANDTNESKGILANPRALVWLFRLHMALAVAMAIAGLVLR